MLAWYIDNNTVRGRPLHYCSLGEVLGYWGNRRESVAFQPFHQLMRAVQSPQLKFGHVLESICMLSYDQV